MNLKNKTVLIRLQYVPWYAVFRCRKRWWCNVPPGDAPYNAVSQEKNPISVNIPLKTIVAIHVDRMHKDLMRFGRIID